MTIGGTVLNSAGLTSARRDIAVFANTNECLRFDEVVMSGTGADDEMVVVAPNGNVFSHRRLWRGADASPLAVTSLAYLAAETTLRYCPNP